MVTDDESTGVFTDWRVEHADVLVAKLHEAGMGIDRLAVHDMVAERVLALSREMGLSASTGREYLTDEAIYQLTASLLGPEATAEVRNEIDPTVSLTIRLLGRVIAGLADVMLYYQTCGDSPSHADRLLDLTEELSLLGAMVGDSPTLATVSVSAALLARLARHLETAANQPNASQQQAALWHRDAIRLQASIDT